ncbi:MAG TPA: hypothetical protein PKA63_04560 [Oligoflexia bacterium]|nr:hypothetical protein [Oligoflexia bacterium]HMP47922.1 hypothetical protein [Oligoflexia bacterium]
MNNRILIIFSLIIFLAFSNSCGGGGGGGDGGGRRSTQTALRVFHAGLDAVPVGVYIGNEFIGETRYLGKSLFKTLKPQDTVLKLTRSDRFNEPVAEFPVSLALNTEYSLFIYGEVKSGTFRVKLLEEPIIRPESGRARVQFLNALSDSGDVRFNLTNLDTVSVRFGTSSGFIDIPEGIYDLRAVSSNGQSIILNSITISDRGETSFLLGGKPEYDFISIKIYEDFD